MIDVRMRIVGDALMVHTPYRTTFPPKARRLGGQWSPERGAWVFDRRTATYVSPILIDCYGTDGTMEVPTVSVRLTGCVYADRGPITYRGRVLAEATGRDSGARLGRDMALLVGSVGSGGSVKYWTTNTRGEDATFLLHDVPEHWVGAGGKDGVWTVEVLHLEPAAPDPASLLAERQSLAVRLAEVDEALVAATAVAPSVSPSP